VSVPTLVGVKVTEQLPVASVQLVAGVNVPVAVPDEVNLTCPVGVLGVPVAVSVIVAVQVEPLFVTTDEGAQLTIVEVERPVTVSVNDWLPVLVLNMCFVSPLYAPLMMWVPGVTTVGVYVTFVAQLAVTPLPVRVHVPVKVPVELLVKVTFPVGVIAPVLFVSVTVAVQLVGLLTRTVAGVQVTVVEVGFPLCTVASSLVVR
jgi:hypothetical protein